MKPEDIQNDIENDLQRILWETRGHPGLSLQRVSERILAVFSNEEVDVLIKLLKCE